MPSSSRTSAALAARTISGRARARVAAASGTGSAPDPRPAWTRRSAGQSTPSAEQRHHDEDGQPAHDPAVAQAVGPLAHGEECEPEDRDAPDGAAGPVDAGAEVAPDGLGQRGRRREEPAEAGRRGGRRHRGDEARHHAHHVEQEHDVEGGAVGLVDACRHVRP